MIFTRMLGLRQFLNLGWACKIGRRALVLAVVLLVWTTGCSELSGTLEANPNIAFMGDSITNYWLLPSTNLGVPGNTTTQMLARFSTEVLGHGYKAVVILGGTNDMRNNALPVEQEVDLAISNIRQMAALAESENILVVLCEILPINNTGTRVVPLNSEIESLALEHQYKLVDYYTPMIGHPEYFKDTLHPNTLGYSVMRTALAKVIPLTY